MATALDAILDEIVRGRSVELVDPRNRAFSYILEQPDCYDPMLRYGGIGMSHPARCVRWPGGGGWSGDKRREAIRENFGTIVTAICAGIPVYQMEDGVNLPADFELDTGSLRARQRLRDEDLTTPVVETPEVVEERPVQGDEPMSYEPIPAVPPYRLSVGPRGEPLFVTEVPPRRASALNITLDAHQPVVLRFADGTEMEAHIRTIEVRTDV